jgi:ABC-2 type transport system ATP-binding protein
MNAIDLINLREVKGMGIISFKDVSKSYKIGMFKKDIPALQSLNLEVNAGDVFGFIGPNGAGKSTTIKILAGLIKPTAGTIMIDGISSLDFNARKKIGFLPESPRFYEYLTGYEYLKLISSLMVGIEKKYQTKEAINECLDLVGLKEAKDKRIRKYSRGMGQRLGIAQAILGDPEILVLDEPLSGLDPFGRRDVRNIILKLKDKGKTIFLSSHIMDDVEKIATRVAIIKNGLIVADGKLSDMTNEVSLEEFFVHEAN